VPQIGSLAHGAHIIVGTPGRVEEHLRKGTLRLDSLNTLVLDEADRMLDMGFQPTLDAIVEYAPQQRQTLLFSATYPDEIQAIAERIMSSPTLVHAGATHDSSTIQQYLYKIDSGIPRISALELLLRKYQPESTLVFCNTRQETREVANELHSHGFSALGLHGDLEQKVRDQTLVRFANKSASVLVATDVAARGLDIDAVDLIINYHIARDIEVHIHRIGRTGRAGSTGIACTLYSDRETFKVALLEETLDQTIDREPLPPLNLLERPAHKPAMVTI